MHSYYRDDITGEPITDGMFFTLGFYNGTDEPSQAINVVKHKDVMDIIETALYNPGIVAGLQINVNRVWMVSPASDDNHWFSRLKKSGKWASLRSE